MNKTLLQLHVRGLTGVSPLFSERSASKYTSFKISKSSFYRSFSSIFHSSSSPNFLHVDQSKFEKVLHSAICVNQLFNITDQTLSKGAPIDHDQCLIERCFFNKCITKGEGGAICYKNNIGTLNISKTLFYLTEASSNGGAIYFQAAKYNFIQVCVDHCKAGNAGQTFSLQPSHEDPCYINYTTSSVCAPNIFGSIQYNLHHVGGSADYHNDNITKGLCDRIGASISCFRVIIPHIFYTNICANKGAIVLNLDFGRDETEFRYCNIFNNTHTQSQILTFSFTTLLRECIIIGNKRPFTSAIMLGKKHGITFEKCAYDALGISAKQDIIINDHRDFAEDQDPTYSYQQQAMAFCMANRKNPIDIWTGFNPLYFALVTVGIIISHICFIHPQFFLETYYFIFFDKKKLSRRKRAHPIVP